LLRSILDFAAEYAAWLVLGSLLSLIVGLVLVPLLILRIPTDYFVYRRRHFAATRPHLLVHIVLTGAKNLLGAVFLVTGVALLVLPGQGLITLFTGLIIMNYPGKFEFERWLVRRPHVLPALNWLRARYRRKPLLAPPDRR
jgi:hypothetical protein